MANSADARSLGLLRIAQSVGKVTMQTSRNGAAAAPADRTTLGVALIIASVFTMAFADAIVKRLSDDVSLWQIFTLRSAAAVPILAAIVVATGAPLAPKRPFWALMRSALLVGTWLSFYAALPALSLSIAAVAMYTAPIIIALLSAALAREPATQRQAIGVIVGFVGVLVILRPDAGGVSWWIVSPLVGAVCYALSMILTRIKCREEAPLTLGLTLHAMFLGVGLIGSSVVAAVGATTSTSADLVFLFGDWGPVDGTTLATFGLLGALAAAYFSGVARAYQIAPPAIIATCDYAYLISAAVWSYAFFAETPTTATMIGMAMITVAGLLVATPRPSVSP